MLTDQLANETLGILLHAAEAAPTLHVRRAWRIESNGHLLDLYLDGSHRRGAADPFARVQRIATGAAAFNLRCAAASLSFGSWVSLCPYPNDPDLLVRMVVEPTGLPDAELQDLYDAMLSRRLVRPPTSPDPALRAQLRRAAELEDATLTWLPVASAPLAVLSTLRDDCADQVRVGMAVQRVLLTATKNDVRATCVNQTRLRFGGSGSA